MLPIKRAGANSSIRSFAADIAFNLAANNHDLAGDLGLHFRPLTDGKGSLAIHFAVDDAVDTRRPVKT